MSAADSVCSDFQPLYGLLQAKLQLITHAYFEEKDFSQISILKVREACLSMFYTSVTRLLHVC